MSSETAASPSVLEQRVVASNSLPSENTTASASIVRDVRNLPADAPQPYLDTMDDTQSLAFEQAFQPARPTDYAGPPVANSQPGVIDKRDANIRATFAKLGLDRATGSGLYADFVATKAETLTAAEMEARGARSLELVKQYTRGDASVVLQKAAQVLARGGPQAQAAMAQALVKLPPARAAFHVQRLAALHDAQAAAAARRAKPKG